MSAQAKSSVSTGLLEREHELARISELLETLVLGAAVCCWSPGRLASARLRCSTPAPGVLASAGSVRCAPRATNS